MTNANTERLLILGACSALLLIGCGGKVTATSSNPATCQAFNNQSNQTSAQLMADWVKAQNDIADPPGTCLNELSMATSSAACQQVLDPKAKSTWPCNLTVISVADNGTGSIPCPEGSGFSKCYGYSSNNTIWVAASGNGPLAITYEMENVILTALGYNTSDR